MADVVSHGDNGSLFHKLINVLIGLEEKIDIVDCLLVVETIWSPNEFRLVWGFFLIAYIALECNSQQGVNHGCSYFRTNS